MTITQISVFIENQAGRLAEALAVLQTNNINILATSLADTTDFGILRLVVDKPELAQAEFKKAGFTVTRTGVVAVTVPDVPGGLAKALAPLAAKNISVEYMYTFKASDSANLPAIILRVEDINGAVAALSNAGVEVLG